VRLAKNTLGNFKKGNKKEAQLGGGKTFAN
jgi:hypothetical protein